MWPEASSCRSIGCLRRSRCPGGVVLFAAVFANPVNLEGVAGGEVLVFVSDLLLEASDFLRKEFHRTAALGADHVVMAAPIVLVLVAGNAVVKGHLAGKAAFGQQFESAVDGGVTDA